MEPFYKRLRRLREDRKLTAHRVAIQIGVSPSTYRAWEYGRNIQGPDRFVKLSQAFNVSLYELMTGERLTALHSVNQLDDCLERLGFIKKDLLLL